MSRQDFHIQQLVFDIHFFSKDKAYDLQTRTSRLFTQQLQNRMQAIFEKEVPPDVLLQADTLVIELGNVSYENFEKELYAKFEAIIADFFAKLSGNETAINSRNYTKQVSVIPLRKSYLQLLENFLLTGVLPDTATGGLPDLEERIEELFARESTALYQLIRSAGQVEAVRKRIAYQFSEPFIKKIITLLEPGEAIFIFRYKEHLETTHQQSPLVTIDTDHFHKEIWVFILTFLLVEKGSQFNRKEFIKSTLKQMAARYNTNYDDLLQYLGQSLSSGDREMTKTELLQLIALLTDESDVPQEIYLFNKEKQTHNTDLPEPEKKSENETEKSILNGQDTIRAIAELHKELQWIYHYFSHGSFPKEADHISRSEWIQRIVSLLRDQPEEINIVLSKFSAETITRCGLQTGGELLAKALIAQRNSIVSAMPVTDLPVTEIQSVSSLTSQQKEDILYHFLRTGFLPWWASQYNKSVHTLPEDVCLASPKEAQQLLQWAGDNITYKERFLNQFPASAIQLFSLLPQAGKAVEMFSLLLFALPDEETKKTAYLRFTEALWNNYHLSQYKAFNEVLFMATAGRIIADLYHIPPGDLQDSLLRFTEKREAELLQQVIHYSLEKQKTKEGLSKSEQAFPGTCISDEELIVLLLSYANESNHDTSVNRVDTGGSHHLQEALIQSLSYFFAHQHFPQTIENKTSASPLLICKKALLLLYSLSATEVEKLLVIYSAKWNQQLLHAGLFQNNDYREKEVLLLLHKINFREAPSLQKEQPVTEVNTSLDNTPLLQRYYLTGEVSFEKKKEKAKQVLSHFLTWQTLPQTAGTAPQILLHELIKELILFLFAADRTALQTLLKNHTNMPAAIIRLSGFIKLEKGGEEALAARFIKPYVQDAALDCLWEKEEVKEKKTTSENRTTISALPDVLSLLPAGSDKDGSAEEQAALWLDHFLLYNTLPAALLRYPQKEAIIEITRFLLRQKKSLLKNMIQKETHLLSARLAWYNWLQPEAEPAGEELNSLLQKAMQKDAITYLQQVSPIPSQEATKNLPSAWKSFSSANEKKTFLQAIARYTTTREEWIRNIPANELYSVLKDTNSQWAKPYIYLLNLLNMLAAIALQSGYEREQFRLHGNVFLLLIIAGTITITDPASFISRFFIYLDQRRPSFIPQLYKNIQEQWEKAETLLAADLFIKKEIHRAVASRLPVSQTVPAAEENRKQSLPSSTLPKQAEEQNKRLHKDNQNEILLPAREGETSKLQLNIEPGTKLYINNAGLVLLHPLIPTLFMLTGLTDKDSFVNEAAQKRAVLLLQYAATNVAEHEEPTLVLNKLLCGLPLEEPVPSSIAVTEKEAKITDELFTIIFQRWPKMKNASAEGFRQSFLQREGRLIKGEKTWAMRVEQRGYDVLLQTLPWAFGLVKLPWMPQAIETEWI